MNRKTLGIAAAGLAGLGALASTNIASYSLGGRNSFYAQEVERGSPLEETVALSSAPPANFAAYMVDFYGTPYEQMSQNGEIRNQEFFDNPTWDVVAFYDVSKERIRTREAIVDKIRKGAAPIEMYVRPEFAKRLQAKDTWAITNMKNYFGATSTIDVTLMNTGQTDVTIQSVFEEFPQYKEY